MGVDLIIKRRSKPSMNSQLFAEYISTVLLLEIDKLRSNEKFTDTEAVLLMDHCSIHVRRETLQMLADHQVKVITFPPQTSHIFYGLGLSLFGNFKKKTNYKLPLDSAETTAGFIKRIFPMMKQTLVPDNERNAFMQLALRYDIDPNPYILLFDEHVLTLWERDSPLKRLSQIRRNAIFGWVNKTMRPDWNHRE
jgi:hypothetical protein